MRAVWNKILGDLRHRRVQTVVVAFLAAMAAGLWIVALNLLAESSNPWEQAFANQRGTHLQVLFDPAKVTGEQLSSTPGLVGASAHAGPWPVANTVRFRFGTNKYALTLVGRTNPGGDVDVLHVTTGRWEQAPGEIVLTRSFAEFNAIHLGDRITAVTRPDKPELTVVGEAIDVDQPDAASGAQSAWVLPDEVSALAPGAIATAMNYRFAQAPSQDQLGQDVARLKAALPDGAVTGSSSFINTERVVNTTNSLIVTLLTVFSIFALAAAAAIVANVVTGAVLASYREVGIMRALGFSPAQVAQVYVGQMLVTAFLGCVVGIPLGIWVSMPLLDRSAHALGLPAPPAIVPALDVAVLIGLMAVVALAALPPAIRASQVSPVRAIALGTAPESRRGSWLGRRLQALHFPRSLSLGAGDAFVRPLRGGLTATGIVVGVATVAFAVGLAGTFNDLIVNSPLSYIQVKVDRYGNYPDATVMSTLQSRPETDTVVAFYQSHVIVPGVPDYVNGLAYRGDVTRIGFALTAGRWYNGPGEAVASPGLLKAANLALGDTVNVTIDGHPTPLRIVGKLLERANIAHELNYDWSTYTQLAPSGMPTNYLVRLQPGADPSAYARAVQLTDADLLDAAAFNLPGALSPSTLITTVVLALAFLLALIATIGVFNTILLNVRERVRDTAILKALGMTPAQILGMVATSACVLGVVGGVLGAPIGVALHRLALAALTAATANDLPADAINIFSPLVFPILVLGAVAVAIAGALLPAQWAARTRVVEVLHVE